MTDLERRYASLLRLYPPAYRRARGAEMLTVLMDSAAPDQHRPPWREVRGLMLGALRVRAGAHGRRTAGQSWRIALRTAALLLLIQAAGDALWQMMFNPDGATLPVVRLAVGVTIAAACALAIVAVLRGRHLTGVVVTTGAFLLQTAGPALFLHFSPTFVTYLMPSWELPLVVVLLLPLAGRGPVTAPRSLNLILLVPVVSVVLDAYGTLTRDPSFQTGSRAVWQALAVAAILWSIVDERVALTVGLAFLSVVVNRALSGQLMWGEWSMWRWTLVDMGVLAILPVLDIMVGAVVAVRRARI